MICVLSWAPVQRSGLLMAPIDQRAGEALTDLMERTRRIPTFAAAVMVEDRIVLEHNADRPLCACSTFKVAAATLRLAQSSVGDALAQFFQVADETLLLLLADRFVLFNPLLTAAQDIVQAFALNELDIDAALLLAGIGW
jgi:hypothetical protein